MGKDGKLPYSQNESEYHHIFRKEMYRLADRAKNKKLGKSQLKDLVDNLFVIYEKSEVDNDLSLQNFFNLLSICEFIGRNLNTILVPQLETI